MRRGPWDELLHAVRNCDAIDSRLLINRTAERADHRCRTAAEIASGRRDEGGRPYHRTFAGPTPDLGDEGRRASARRDYVIGPRGRDGHHRVTHRHSVDQTKLVHEAADQLDVEQDRATATTPPRPPEISPPPCRARKARSGGRGRVLRPCSTTSSMSSQNMQYLESRASRDNGQVECNDHYKDSGSPLPRADRRAIIG